VEYDLAGEGNALVLLHAGIADRRMWDPQWRAFAEGHRVIRADARGFGATSAPDGPYGHHLDLATVLDDAGVDRADLVGVSLGAGTAVVFALAFPNRVRSLVLVSPGGDLYAPEPPDDLRAFWREEWRLLEAGDVDGAVELNLRTWVDGPHRRPDEVDQEVRAFVGRMQREAFAKASPDDDGEVESEPPITRLAELELPILVVVGDADQPDTIAIGRRIAAEVPDARLVSMPGVAHMPTLERQGEFERLVLDFLAEVGP
jgi:pimeloyl-ACP methyl ester carboxylesterase